MFCAAMGNLEKQLNNAEQAAKDKDILLEVQAEQLAVVHDAYRQLESEMAVVRLQLTATQQASMLRLAVAVDIAICAMLSVLLGIQARIACDCEGTICVLPGVRRRRRQQIGSGDPSTSMHCCRSTCSLLYGLCVIFTSGCALKARVNRLS